METNGNNNSKIYSVYVHTNLTNGKKYVGITRKKPKERWRHNGSGYINNPKFWADIQKYGWDEGFSHEVVETGLTCYEAAKKEIELIKEYDSFKHGYNRSLGGEGMEGYKVGSPIKERMSPEVYAEWSAKNAERMKRLGVERTRQIISLTENKIYQSAVEASEVTHIPVERVRDMCNRNKRTHFYDPNGYCYRFCWYSRDFDMTMDEFTISYYPKAIICLETEQIFANAVEAEHIMHIPHNRISAVCKGTWVSVYGYKFIYYKDYINGKRDTRLSKNIEKNRHEVICLETNKIYYNHVEAAEDFQCNSNMISRAVHNFNFTCKGFHFADYNDYKANPDKYVLPEIKDMSVMQFDKFGKFIAEYASYKEAGLQLNVSAKNINSCCIANNCKRLICHNSLWMYKCDYNKDSLYERVQLYWESNQSSKCVGQYDVNGELINIYESAASASKAVGCTQSPIAQSCKEVKGMIKGYQWKYVSPMTYLDNLNKQGE